MEFRITVDVSQVAAKLNTTRELIETKLVEGVRLISASTHAFIVNKASELEGWKRDAFLGIGKFGKDAQRQSTNSPLVDSEPKYVRWIEISQGLWVVEIDEKAAWVEQGRESVSMATEQWLLKPGKVKHARDGSVFRSIPFTYGSTGQKGAKLTTPVNAAPAIQTMVKNVMESGRGVTMGAGISGKESKRLKETGSKGLIRDASGGIALGMVAKLNIEDPGTQYAGFHSRPRSAEDAAKSGLAPHGGIFFLKGAAVYQSKDDKGKVSRNTVVFRTVSSKHQAENRWQAPAVQPFNSIPAANDFAQKAVDDMIRSIGEEIRRTG